jgi:hypothetical protein
MYYDYEEAFLRYDHNAEKFFLKLLNSGHEYDRPRDNRLVCDIWRFGNEITQEQYLSEKPPKA